MKVLNILTCFTSVQLYTQSDENVPVLGNDSYGPCGNWWNQVIFDNAVFIVVGFKSLKKNNCLVKRNFCHCTILKDLDYEYY